MSEEPFLQIVHISDIHVIASGFTPQPDPGSFRNGLKNLSRIAPRVLGRRLTELGDLIRDGTAGHLPQARRAFAAFLAELTVQDEQFKDLPTWLVQTGDLTTYGDPESIKYGQLFLDRLHRETRAEVVSIHGNHDAWPCALPMGAISKISEHEKQLRTAFPDNWPRPPLVTRLPDNSGEIQLYGIDTVNPTPWQNLWARGAIPRKKLETLGACVRAHVRDRERQLRILVSHHPLWYPEPRPRYQMVLRKWHLVCDFLKTGGGTGVSPLAHLILSGHTHQLSPSLFTLPETVRECDQIPLGDEQCQLVVGSLAQLDPKRTHGDHAHQCQILRFYYDRGDPGVVLMQRLLAARRSGQGGGRGTGFGRYEIIDEPQNGAASVQTMTFEL